MLQSELPDTSGIPDRLFTQDQVVTTFVARKGGDTPDVGSETDAVALMVALGDLLESQGFDLSQSYIAVKGIDVDIVTDGGETGVSTIQDFLDAITAPPAETPEPQPEPEAPSEGDGAPVEDTTPTEDNVDAVAPEDTPSAETPQPEAPSEGDNTPDSSSAEDAGLSGGGFSG